VYSPHDYGPGVYQQPWFTGDFTQASLLADVWRPNWFYLLEEGSYPLLVGEWGGYMDGGSNTKWLTLLRDFMKQYKISHTFWCLNPNSGDTGGILQNDWTTVTADGKYELVKQSLWTASNGKFVGLDHEINLGANGTNVTAYYGGSTVPPTATPTPARTATRTATQAATRTATPTVSGRLRGDVNGDGVVNIVDALIIAQCYVGLATAYCTCDTIMDVDSSGSCDIIDALKVAQYSVGLNNLIHNAEKA